MEQKQFEIYMDYAATTPMYVTPTIKQFTYANRKYGNPSSAHDFGYEAKYAIEMARKQVAELINSEPNEIYFTSGGTESNNWALRCTNKKNLFTSKMEHDAVTKTAEILGKYGMKNLFWIPHYKNGYVNMEYLLKRVDKHSLVSVMTANNELGIVQKLAEIGTICHSVGAYFHTDATQALGKIPIDVKRMKIDMLSASGHKIGAGKGIGILYIRNGVDIAPLLYGGGQERGMRSGTENVPGIVSFGEACRINQEQMDSTFEKLFYLKNKFESDLILGDVAERIIRFDTMQIPNISTMYFPHLLADNILDSLNDMGIYVSAGSACSNNTGESFKSLKVLGYNDKFAEHVVRFSFGKHLIEEDIDNVVSALLAINYLSGKN